MRAKTSWKMLMNNEFKADISTGNPTGNSRCHTLASYALNMSCIALVNQRTHNLQQTMQLFYWRHFRNSTASRAFYITSLGHLQSSICNKNAWSVIAVRKLNHRQQRNDMHVAWYDYVVYLINIVVVDGFVLSWRQAISSMMIHASHHMSGVARCNDRNLRNTNGFPQRPKTCGSWQF